jgi:hypothetical protein
MEFVRAGGLSGEKIVIVFRRKREMGGWNVMARAERAAKKARPILVPITTYPTLFAMVLWKRKVRWAQTFNLISFRAVPRGHTQLRLDAAQNLDSSIQHRAG